MVRVFWTDEYANYDQKYVKEAIAPIQNKVGQFLSSAIIRNIVGQPKSTIDLRNVMDDKKILLMDLSKGKVGEENAALLGAMIITKLQLAAMSRVDMLEEERPDFYLYVDEFQNFATESFATILSEARKYHLNLVMGHQYIGQLTPTKDNTRLRDAIFGNVGTMVTFRIGAADAEYLETEFAPTYTPNDLVNLPKYNILLKLMINGVSSEPFSARSIQVNPEFRTGNSEKVIRVSRERYGNPIAAVEERISRWMGAEFHQQSAVLAAGDEEDKVQGRSPEKVQEKRFIESPERPVVRPRNDEGPREQVPGPRPEPSVVQAPVEQEPDAPEVVTPTSEPVKSPTLPEPSEGGPLVFKMPEIPKPAPAPVFSRTADSNRGDRSPARPVRFSGQPQEQQRRRAEPFSGHAKQFDTNRRGQAPRGQEQKGRPNSKTSPRPNIWDTVAEIHEEKVQHFGKQIAGVVGGGHNQDHANQKKANSPTPAPAPATSAKVLKPGEVLKF
jgi:hypothetical protein